MSQKRYSTSKPGVFYRELAGSKPSKPTRMYYIRYRQGGRAGKLIEEPVGKSTEGITPTIAANMRAERITKKALTNQERRQIAAQEKAALQNKWTISRLWEEYKSNKPRLKGIVTDNNRFKNHLTKLADYTPEELTTQMVDSLRIDLLNCGKAPQTTKNVIELLRRIINFGVKKGLCPWQSPSKLHFEMPKINNIKTEFLTSEQRHNLLKAIEAAPNRKAANVMLMAYYTGMRRNELFGLKWKHIDFENGFINIVGEQQEGAKSSQNERIPLSNIVRDLLERIEKTSNPYVFQGKNGIGRLQDLNKQLNIIKKAANLPVDFRPLHGLRHTFASVAVSNGIPLSQIQKLLTHKDPKLTLRYAHLEDSALIGAADSLAKILERKEP